MHKHIKIIGCGYIGRKISKLLAVSGIQPDCFVRTEESLRICKKETYQALQFDLDKNNLQLDTDVLCGFSDSAIVYLVPPPPNGLQDTRIQNFLLMLRSLKLPPAKIVLISTTGIYGDCKGAWIDEDQQVNPQADRAHRRLSAERQLKEYCKKIKIPCIIFRVPGIYAADKLPIKRITSAEPIVSADDSGFTNRIHADDLSAFCVEALTCDVKAGVYNCCDGHPSTMNDYFIKVADAMALQRPVEISLQQARKELSPGMLSYLAESKRISNKKLLKNFTTRFKYPDLHAGLQGLIKNSADTLSS